MVNHNSWIKTKTIF